MFSDSLLPIASFVEEILAQSRTSGAVLMAAMSYLETLRPQIPDLQTSYARSASSSELSGSPYILDPSKLGSSPNILLHPLPISDEKTINRNPGRPTELEPRNPPVASSLSTSHVFGRFGPRLEVLRRRMP